MLSQPPRQLQHLRLFQPILIIIIIIGIVEMEPPHTAPPANGTALLPPPPLSSAGTPRILRTKDVRSRTVPIRRAIHPIRQFGVDVRDGLHIDLRHGLLGLWHRVVVATPSSTTTIAINEWSSSFRYKAATILSGITPMLRHVHAGGGHRSSDRHRDRQSQYENLSNHVDRLRGERELCQLLDGVDRTRDRFSFG